MFNLLGLFGLVSKKKYEKLTKSCERVREQDTNLINENKDLTRAKTDAENKLAEQKKKCESMAIEKVNLETKRRALENLSDEYKQKCKELQETNDMLRRRLLEIESDLENSKTMIDRYQELAPIYKWDCKYTDEYGLIFSGFVLGIASTPAKRQFLKDINVSISDEKLKLVKATRGALWTM